MLCRIYAAYACCAIALLVAIAAHAASPKLRIAARIELPGGVPASGAHLLILESPLNKVRRQLQADADGQFAMVDSFEERTLLIAHSSDRKLQRRVAVAASEARTLSRGLLVIELRPARQVRVRVLREGQPVARARVSADQTATEAVTGDDGQAVLLIPDDNEVTRVSAWHPQLGVGGIRLETASPGQTDATLDLPLQHPQPRLIRVVDALDQPVPELGFWPNFRPATGDWFIGRTFEHLRLTTDARGEIKIAWAPKDLQGLDVDGLPPDWVLEQIVQPTATEPSPVVRLRRKRLLSGRLITPDGCDPAGLYIAGRAFGPSNRGDLVSTRAAADGSFSLAIAPEFAYALAVHDQHWTSEPLTGVLARQAAEGDSAPLELRVEPATPLEVRATIGAEQKPLAGGFVSVLRIVESEWVDASGEKRSGRHSLGDWLMTDSGGIIRTGLGRGSHRVSLAHENWRDEKTIDITSIEPVSLAFHKPYEHRRQIRGRLTQSGRQSDFSDVKVTAVEFKPFGHLKRDVAVGKDGAFEFSTDCQRVIFFALDYKGEVCGSATAAETDSSADIELQPLATYEGQIVGRDGGPLPVVSLTLALQAAPDVFVRLKTTNQQGQFRFDSVFSGQPLRLSASIAGKQVLLDQHYFEPGEKRQGVRLRIHPSDVEQPKISSEPLVRRLEAVRRDARLAKMHVLIAIHGDNLETVKFLQHSVLDWEQSPAVVEYLPLIVGAQALRDEPADLEYAQKADWPVPESKQVALITLNGVGELLGTKTISFESPAALADVQKLLEEHRPPPVDGKQLWRSALSEAQQSGRRVLLQVGGPRCGPCFRLSRWTEDHQQALEKDYVIVKLHQGRHSGADAIEQQLRGKSGSIPWMAIVDADASVQATSDGPLGNIGFPSSVEGVRHFQRMLEKTAQRLTAEEIERLVATLWP